MRTIDRLVLDNVGLLKQGADLVHGIGDELFANNRHEYFDSGVGKHFRHVIDFYRAFLSGAGETIRYDARDRDPKIESESSACADALTEIVRLLEALPESLPGEAETLISPEALEGDETLSGAVISSVNRELQYLLDHTIHHYAIIALTLRVQGTETDKYFGYAPSTITYLESGKT